MRITFDTRAQMAKIYVIDHIARGGVARTEALILEKHLVNLDWNADEQLIGIEIGLAALPQEARKLAEDITFRGRGETS
jgi:hypothetical protein